MDSCARGFPLGTHRQWLAVGGADQACFAFGVRLARCGSAC